MERGCGSLPVCVLGALLFFAVDATAQPEGTPPPPPPPAGAEAPPAPTSEAPAPAPTTAPAPPPTTAPPPAPGAAPPPGYPPPGYPPPYGYGPPPYGYGPPPPPPEDLTIHNHDGFYLHMALGGGYLSDKASVDNTPFEATLSGGAFLFDILLGGTLGSGFVLGGGVMGAAAPKPNVSSGGQQVQSTSDVQLSMVGVIGDWYVDPHQGFHVGALVGYAEISATNSNGQSSTENPTGLGLAFWLGNEWWIGDQWSIGVEGRLQYAPLTYSSGAYTEHDNVLVPGVLLSFTFH